MTPPQPIPAGATLGMLGGGQLGRLFTQAAQAMGYKVHIFCPEPACPASQIADAHTCAEYNDTHALTTFATTVSVITLEFENIPATCLQHLLKTKQVHPGLLPLQTAQHRLREKNFLSNHHFPIAPFQPVNSLNDLKKALQKIGTPAVLKTAGFGYDGKGQFKLNNPDQAQQAWASMDNQPSVLESWITYQRELSIIAARNPQSDFKAFPLFENQHQNHILDITHFPASVEKNIQHKAETIAQRLMKDLQYVGLLCIEFFLTEKGELLINEIAPRPHNSGHLTIEAAATSQYQQHVRAICALPLASTTPHAPAAMVNLLGDVWENGEPDWNLIKKIPEATLHLYGKTHARIGRKMGHLTVLAKNTADAANNARQLRDKLAKKTTNTP